MTTLPFGMNVTIVEQGGGWSAIRLVNGQVGWVASQYLRGGTRPTAPTPTPTPTQPVTVQPSPTPTASATSTATPQANGPGVSEALRQHVAAAIQHSAIQNQYGNEAQRLGASLLTHLNEFQLTQENITAATMQSVLLNTRAGDRINAVVHRVWDDWRQYGIDHMTADPAQHGQSPFRQLIIRLVQGRQGTLTAQDQRALYSLFTRSENNWSDQTVRGVIGAINQGIYGQ